VHCLGPLFRAPFLLPPTRAPTRQSALPHPIPLQAPISVETTYERQPLNLKEQRKTEAPAPAPAAEEPAIDIRAAAIVSCWRASARSGPFERDIGLYRRVC
jgi:hypothetical protein